MPSSHVKNRAARQQVFLSPRLVAGVVTDAVDMCSGPPNDNEIMHLQADKDIKEFALESVFTIA